MKKYNLKDMKLGWFVGQFSPTSFKTDACEIAIKYYKSGDYDKSHHHKIATEITAIIDGKVKMNNVEYNKDDIIIIEPNEITDFLVLSDTITVVIKIPGVLNDKYNEIGN